jgi:hypothetical protein
MMQHISIQYFDYRPPAGHLEGCPRHGSDVWEVTRWQERSFDDEHRQTVIRLVCSECGVIHLESSSVEPSTSTTHAAELGFGSRPVREAGLWLWAGPLIWHGDDRGPTVFFVTSTKSRPRSADDVLGVVGWGLGQRGGVKWFAGTGYAGWGVKEACPDKFATRRAAVKWIAAELGIVRGDQ